MSKLKKTPKFKIENEEREFWSRHDSPEYVDYSRAKKPLLPNLKRSIKAKLIRLPESLIEKLKGLANKRDVPYQSLLKIFLDEKKEYLVYLGIGVIGMLVVYFYGIRVFLYH